MYICTKNAMALGTATVTGEDANNPKERLFDRDRNDLWRYTATGAVTFDVNIGSGTQLDMLVIDAHNFDGETIAWQRYDSGAWTDIVTAWSQSGNERIVKTASAPVTDTRFRVTVTSMTDPECAEITMTLVQAFDPVWTSKPGINNNQTVDYSQPGARWVVKNGEEKWFVTYNFELDEADSELTGFMAAMAEIDYGLHAFYIYDHEAVLRFVEVMLPFHYPYAIEGNMDIHEIQINLQEVI